MNKPRLLSTMLALAILSSIAVADTTATGGGLGGLSTALKTLCEGIKGLIPIVAFLMIVSAGVIYAAGQLLGAETRARASVWATAMLVGAVIGLLIVVITPPILTAMYSSDATTGASFGC